MQLHEIAIFTDDVDAMADFYEKLLGAKPVHCGDGIAIFQAGEAQVLIHVRYEPGPGELPCENHTAFRVENLDEAVNTLASRGIAIETPPRAYDWGRSAYLRDPAGRLLELHEHNS